MSIVSQVGNSRLLGRHKEALDLLSNGRIKDALLILVDLADAEPDNHLVCLDLGNVVLNMGMPEQAVVAARRAVELDSTSVEAFILLARALEKQGNLKDANVALGRAVDLLRNPSRSEDDLKGAEVVPPLALAQHSAIFINFELLGDASNLTLKSTTMDKGKTFIILMTLSGQGVPQKHDDYDILESGELPRARVLKSLPERQATAVNLFTGEAFKYTLMQKKKKG